jgi:two-component system, chemotaxis family, protein-glutamate methylesterase/glutaminase
VDASAPASPGVVAIAASLGGVQACRALLGALPADFPAPLLVVQHRDPRYPRLLAQVLARATKLEVLEPEGRTRLRAGRALSKAPGAS